MRFPRSLAVITLFAAVALAAPASHAQTNATGLPTFPDLQKLRDDLTQPPTSTPPSQGPFGEQPNVPVPNDHPPPPSDTPSPWPITPQVELSEEVTDNVEFTHTNRQADLQTFLNPSIAVNGDTNLVKVDLNYSPTLLRNVVETSGNRIDQNFFGTGTFTAVPDALFLNTRASASEASRSGSFGPVQTTQLRTDDRTQVLAYDAGPEWRFPLVEDATGDLRYSIGQARFYDNTDATLSTADGQPLVDSGISTGTLQDLRLFLDCGDRGKLISGQFTAEGTRDRISDGGGTDDTGTIQVESQLRLSPTLQLLGSTGYEDLTYSAIPAANVNDPIWYGGFRWQNAQDSYVQLTYGHKQGIDSFSGQLHMPVTPLTSVFAEYGESVTTPQQQILNNLNGSALTASNVVIDPNTGLPQSLSVNELALQNSIYRDRDFRTGLITVNEPDLFTVEARYQSYVPIAGLPNDDSYLGLDALWNHAMNETTTFSLLGSYYLRQQFDESTYLFRATISRLMTPTLVASLGYQFIYGGANTSSREYYQNSITAYLRKTF